MSEILQSKRQAEGKATLPHHYGNEALLCNAALTGQFKPLERDKLDKAGLSLLTRLEARNAALIGSGMGYRERKAALFDMAASYRHGMSEVGFSHFVKTKKGGDLSRQGTLGRPPTKAV